MKKINKTSFPTIEVRQKQYFEAAAAYLQHCYDGEGQWMPTTTPSETRERYWGCFALYACGLNDLADAVIRSGPTLVTYMGKAAATTFDIFHTNIACMLLVQHRGRMAADVQKKLEGVVRNGFDFQPGNRRPDYQFRGLNDNMPAKATMGLILGGEMLGNSEVVEHGLWNLRQLRSMLFRRGINSEYNSPTYTPLTVHAMGEIVAHSANAEARQIAKAVEERLWIDLAARFHSEIGVISGPYSRAYTIDTIAHLSCASGLLWFVLGEQARPSPMELFKEKEKNGLVLHHLGDVPFNVAQICWFAAGTYHVPVLARALFQSKKYPFRAVASAEVDQGGIDIPAHPLRVESYLQADYSIGTSNAHWLNGDPSMTYFVTYKRASEVKSFRDVGTVFHRFTINGEVPGTVKHALASDARPYSNKGEKDIVNSWCNLITLQSQDTVLALSHPALYLAGVEGERPPVPVDRMDEMVIFPAHFGGADKVRVGDQSRNEWEGEVKRGEWIGCRRGRLLIAIRPLVYTKDLGAVKITLEKINNYEVIRSTFYRGTKRTFTRTELGNVFGGFVAEHASADDFRSLEAFMKAVALAGFTDYHFLTRIARYRRPALGTRPALDMGCSWSVGARVTRFAMINGVPVEVDPVLQIDGVQRKDCPILNRPWVPPPTSLPWDPMDCLEHKLIGVVGDRGDL